MDPETARQIPVRYLAYLGDAAAEIVVREYLVTDAKLSFGEHPSEKALEFVTAEAQSLAADRILPLLTEEESEVYHRGRNGVHGNAPKHATVAEYRKATGLECLFGYLYLIRRNDRMKELFCKGFLEKPGDET